MSALVKLYRCWFVWLAVLSRHLVVLSFPFMIETCTVYIIYILCMYCSCICHLIGNKILVLVLVIRRQFMITDAVAQNHTQWYMLIKKKKNKKNKKTWLLFWLKNFANAHCHAFPRCQQIFGNFLRWVEICIHHINLSDRCWCHDVLGLHSALLYETSWLFVNICHFHNVMIYLDNMKDIIPLCNMGILDHTCWWHQMHTCDAPYQMSVNVW